MTIQEIKDKGIVGAGGAGFPTHIKLQTHADVIIMNAAECEPLLHKDIELLNNHTEDILKGFRMALALTGARHGIIGIKEKHRTLITQLKDKLPDSMEIVPVEDFYPAGDEVTLVYLTTGRLIQPGQLPASVGCVVQNVETLFNLNLPGPLTHKFLTVAGEVDTPQTVAVPIGTSFGEVLSHFKITTRNIRIRSGGLMMGTLEKSADAVVTKTTGGLIVLPQDHPCVQMYERYAAPAQTDRTAKSSCDQCSFCTELCPRYLLGHPVRPETAMRNRMFTRRDMSLFHSGNAFCCECNLCTLYSCPEGLDPRGATVIEKNMMDSEYPPWEGLPVSPHPMIDYRRVPVRKLKQRLQVTQYRDEGPLYGLKIEPEKVRIPFKQHIGRPAQCIVETGQKIQRSEKIAEADGDLSVPVHASIEGRVREITETEIVIQRDA